MRDPKGYYKILGINPDAEPSAIKESYRDLAKKWHPDYNKAPDALEKFQKISVAYNILEDEKSRLIYDLLSEVYRPDNFPDMSALKVYKNQKDKEDLSIRALSLKQVIGKLSTVEVTEDKFICNFSEAELKVLQNHFSNWILGWWGIKAFRENLTAIKQNYQNMGTNLADNFQLLAHNMIAYDAEGKKDKAYVSALQAMQYADSEQKRKIHKYIYLMGVEGNPKLPRWNWSVLRYLQLLIPGMILLMLSLSFASKMIANSDFNKYWLDRKNINYYREVRLQGSESTVDDVVVSKIVNLPPDTTDTTLLYHVTGFVEVMYGPSEEFDVYTRLGRGHTVRLTGYSPDKVWARVMIDSGETGFVKMNQIRKGIQNPIPADSKIYTGFNINE